MDIDQAADLLEQVGIKTKATNDSIHVIPFYQDENIYKLEKRGVQWVYLFIENERGTGKETILETFQSEEKAAIYFLLVTIRSSLKEKYVYPYIEKNASLNIGDTNFTFADLQKALDSLPIRQVNYSFFDEATVPYSIHLSRVTPTESKVQFIGKNNQVVFETIDLEDGDAYSAMFDYVFLLALLEETANRLVQPNKLMYFTDEEIGIFLFL
ncbi:hypothetical protein [Bacillus sp. B-jedd]|uniref:hypothetical protein n=1 Tax=Bacillus sp. B-jedd TaxID=1476857 RepID=UPI00051570D5|nr:hypothetical protein [Bacillus sp. B-jedd]CEG26920.1 hypothetical protein BN1002_01773 [Bacillus sp. B-jedd]